MAATQKLSVSIGREEARWARARARRRKKSVSAVLTEALATVRQLEARREFLENLDASEFATDAEARSGGRTRRAGNEAPNMSELWAPHAEADIRAHQLPHSARDRALRCSFAAAVHELR